MIECSTIGLVARIVFHDELCVASDIRWGSALRDGSPHFARRHIDAQTLCAMSEQLQSLYAGDLGNRSDSGCTDDIDAGAFMDNGPEAASRTYAAAMSRATGGAPPGDDPARSEPVSREQDGKLSAHNRFNLRQRPPHADDPFTTRQQTLPGIVATVVHIKDSVSYDFRFEGADCCIVLLDLYRADGTTQLEGRRLPHVKDMRNRLTFLTSGCDFSGWTHLEQPGEFFAIQIARETASQRGIDLERLPPRHGFADQALRTIMRRLRALFDDASVNRPGYAETLADLLCFELERAMSQQAPPALQQGGLTARQVRIVTEYMEDRLAEKIAIADLAALLGLTRFHFIRSFQQNVGLPPLQFLIRCRIERARELLKVDTLNVADVAAQSGFGGTVQLTRAFRRVVGTTPSRYRRGLK